MVKLRGYFLVEGIRYYWCFFGYFYLVLLILENKGFMGWFLGYFMVDRE